MAYGFNGTNGYIQNLENVITGAPVSFSAQVYPQDTTNYQLLFSIGNPALTTEFLAVALRGDVGGDPLEIRCIAVAGSGDTEANQGGAFAANTWTQVGGVFASSTVRTLYQDGVALTAATKNLTPSGINVLVIGAEGYNSVVDQFFTGRMQNIGVWNDALTDAEMKSLSKGVSPRLIRPRSLIYCFDAIRGEANVRRSPVAFNNITQAPGTNTIMPHRRGFLKGTATSPPPPPAVTATTRYQNLPLLGVS